MKKLTITTTLLACFALTGFAQDTITTTNKTIKTMKQRINVLTIGVTDLEKSLKFYRDGMGLQTEGIVGKEFEH